VTLDIQHLGSLTWRAPEPAPRTHYPAPLLTSREPADMPVPEPVASLAEVARGFGWTVDQPRMSRGLVPHSTYGTPGKAPKTIWALRMYRGSRRAVATRWNDTWSSFWTWSPEQFFTRHDTLEAFKGVLI